VPGSGHWSASRAAVDLSYGELYAWLGVPVARSVFEVVVEEASLQFHGVEVVELPAGVDLQPRVFAGHLAESAEGSTQMQIVV